MPSRSKGSDEFPQVRVVTKWNAMSNEAMLWINERLGFRAHRLAVMPQLRIEALEAYLARLAQELAL